MTREEAIKTIRLTCPKISDSECDFETAMRFLIPELRESEDERIRKGLIEALKTPKTVGELKFILPEPTREECIAYLEKQKEQKPVNHSLTTWHRDVVYCAMCNKNLNEGLRCNLEMVYKTIKELVDRTPVIEEPKPAEWSEEDEKMLNNTLDSLKRYQLSMPNFQVELQMRWLKSLRPVSKESLQSHWKPSEEQMKALKEVAYSIVGTGTQTDVYLVQLYEQLKKL